MRFILILRLIRVFGRVIKYRGTGGTGKSYPLLIYILFFNLLFYFSYTQGVEKKRPIRPISGSSPGSKAVGVV